MSEYRYIGNLEENDHYREEDPSQAFSDEEIATLKAIKTGKDIKSIKIGNDYVDDHEICVELEVNGVKFEALWIVRSFFAAIIRAEMGDKKGKNQLASYIVDHTEMV